MRRAFSLLIVVFPLMIVASGCTKEKPASTTVTGTVVSNAKTHEAIGPTTSPTPAAPITSSPLAAKPKQPLQLTKENLIGSWAYKKFNGKEYCYADFTADMVKLKLKDTDFTIETERPYVIDKDGKARIDPNPDGTLTHGYIWFGPRDELCIIYYISKQKARDTSNLRPDFTLGRVK